MKNLVKIANQINTAFLVCLIAFLIILNGVYDSTTSTYNFKKDTGSSQSTHYKTQDKSDTNIYLIDDLDPDDDDALEFKISIPIIEYLHRIFSDRLLTFIYQTNCRYHYFNHVDKKGQTYLNKTEPSDLEVFLI